MNEDESLSKEEEMVTEANDSVEQPSAQSPKIIQITDEELKNLQKEVMEYKDKYLRLLAESENMRKRMQKERQELTKYAVENIIVDFLRPLDNLENALKFAQQMSDEVKNWAFGFQMIVTQFKDVLINNGVVAIESLGTPFDPHSHEAIEMVESPNHLPGHIVEECARGYRMGERTIRPARVKVAKAITEQDTQETQEKI